MSCPHCGRDVPRLARRCPYCDTSYSPETRANRLKGRDFILGHFYPLDVEKALSLETGLAYIEKAAERARREPRAARHQVRLRIERERTLRQRSPASGTRR